MDEIIVKDVRVLRPSEFKALLGAIPKLDNQTRVKISLYTGMRPIELIRWHKHDSKARPESQWYMQKNNAIKLPKEAIFKEKRKSKERFVRLNQQGKEIVPYFLKLKKSFSTAQAWGQDLKRWAELGGISPKMICPMSFRKTWESWLVFCYEGHQIKIFQSQGHTGITALEHYVNTPFTEIDKVEMAEFVGGWI